jgi:hypothetical protein
MSGDDWGDDDWRDDEWDDPDSLHDTAAEQLRLRDLMSDGANWFTSTTGAILTALLSVLLLARAVFTESTFAAWVAFMREAATDPEMIEQFEQSGLTREEVLETLDTLGPFPLAVDLPTGVLLLGILLTLVLAETVRIVGIRSFAAGELDGIPGDLAKRRLLAATLLGWVGGIVVAIGVVIGLGLLVVPGLFLAVVTMFFHHEVAVADKGIIGALGGSWDLARGHWMELFGLVVVLVIVALVPVVIGIVIGGVVPPTSPVGPIANAIVQAVTFVFSMGVVTSAYVQLRGDPSDTPERI